MEVRRAAAPRSIKDWLLDVAGLGEDSFGIVTASDPVAIAALFAYGGWSYGAPVGTCL